MQRLFRFTLFALVGLAADVTPSALASENVTPPLNSESAARVGSDVLRQGHLYQQAAIHLSEEIKFGKDGVYTLTPGYYVRTGERIGWETYAPTDSPDAGRVKAAPGAITLQGSFHYSNDGTTIGVITNFYQAVNARAKSITRTLRPAWSRDQIQRTVVYGGKTGTRIRLSYREIWKNVVRPSGEVFVEYDLTDSKTIEIKGARIEVIDATNRGIRYRVTQAFDSTKK